MHWWHDMHPEHDNIAGLLLVMAVLVQLMTICRHCNLGLRRTECCEVKQDQDHPSKRVTWLLGRFRWLPMVVRALAASAIQQRKSRCRSLSEG